MVCRSEEECYKELERAARRFLEELDKLLRGIRNGRNR
jgi:hypothetical protein